MSALVDRAIEAAGLTRVADARRVGPLSEVDVRRLRGADLLALGALADRVRAEDVGAGVVIYAGDDRLIGAPFALFPHDEGEWTGLELLREVAVARIAGPVGGNVRVDWTRSGLELAQVSLGFGANELTGTIASKRGLPIADGELAGVGKRSRRELARLVKQRELASLIRRAGRVPHFVGADGDPEAFSETGAQEAT